jgi:hypothetical protein
VEDWKIGKLDTILHSFRPSGLPVFQPSNLPPFAAGHHRVTDIVSAAGLPGTKQAGPYLARLR